MPRGQSSGVCIRAQLLRSQHGFVTDSDMKAKQRVTLIAARANADCVAISDAECCRGEAITRRRQRSIAVAATSRGVKSSAADPAVLRGRCEAPPRGSVHALTEALAARGLHIHRTHSRG